MPKLTGFWQTSNGYTKGFPEPTHPTPHSPTWEPSLYHQPQRKPPPKCASLLVSRGSAPERGNHTKQRNCCSFVPLNEWGWHHFCFRGADGFTSVFHKSYDMTCTNGLRLPKTMFSYILTQCFWSIWSQGNISMVSDMCHSLNNTLVSTTDMYGKC